MNYRISYQCCSHTGKLRKNNQDNFLCGGQVLPADQGTAPAFVQGAQTGQAAVFGVFDGMGGEEKGELAALMAAETAAQMQPGDAPLEDLIEVCRKANGKICRYIQEENLRAMGTTAAMLCISGEEASLCSVGDSSIFRLRQGKLEQLNQLHTVPGAYGTKPGLYQYLGIPEGEQLLEPDLRRERLSPGDEYLLCTDGLTDMLTRTELEQILNTQPFEEAAQRLQDAALERGGKDNITLILCRVEEREEKGKTVMTKKEASGANNPSRKTRRNLLLAAALILVAAIAAAAGYLNTPVEIRVARQPDKTEYLFAERFEPEGLALEVTYRSGKTETVTQFVFRPPVLNESGTQQITLQWKDLTVQFPVEVVAPLEQIRVATLPDTLWYVAGDSLDAAGLTLEASYTDGSTAIVTEGFTLENTALTQPGEQTVTVRLEDQTAAFDVFVVEVTGITVKTPAARQTYMVGQTLEPGGLTLTAYYSDGTQKTIEEGFSCQEVTFDREGQQDITVTYAGHEATFPVTVYPQVTFARLRAYGGAGSDSYGSGQNQNGRWITWRLYVEHTLEDGLWEIFRPGISCSWADVVNGDRWEENARFEYAKEGQTHVEYGILAGRGTSAYFYSLNLPDDPSIAGEQWVEIYVGNSTKRITFTLTYLGDYETGTGWRVSNIKF